MTSSPRAGSSMLRLVGTNAGIKVLVMGLSGAMAFVTTRLIIGNFGVGAYAQYGLLASMAALVPFADLGMSAAVLNAVSSSAGPRTDVVVRRTIVSAVRVLLASGALLALLGLFLTAIHAWPTVLGNGLLPHGGTAALVCVLVFSIMLPVGVGQQILTGLGKNHLQIGTQALAAPFILVMVVVMVAVGGEAGNYVAVLSYLAGLLVAGASLLLAARLIRPQVRDALRGVPRIKSVPGVKVMQVAWPMLVQMLALPLALQTDRLLLSHLAPTDDLAQYNLAAQLFGLIVQTIGSAGIALWPVFARARSERRVRSPFALMWVFLGGGLLLAGALAALLPWIIPIVSDGRIELGGWLVFGFVAFVAAEAAKYPIGMYMTDLRGLRFQIRPILLMVPANLALSWALIAPLGAAGPVIGSAITVAMFQVLPCAWYVRKDLALRRSDIARDQPEAPRHG